MSFVSIVFNQRFITIMSDGLITNIKRTYTSDGQYHDVENVKEEHAKKFYHISKDQFVTFTGIEEWRKILLASVPENKTGSRHNLRKVAALIRQKSFQSSEALRYGTIKNSFIVLAGININGEIEVYAIPSSSEKINYYQAVKEKTLCLALASPKLANYPAADILDQRVNELSEITVRAVLDIQEEINMEVAKRDPSVNDQISYDFITND